MQEIDPHARTTGEAKNQSKSKKQIEIQEINADAQMWSEDPAPSEPELYILPCWIEFLSFFSCKFLKCIK